MPLAPQGALLKVVAGAENQLLQGPVEEGIIIDVALLTDNVTDVAALRADAAP